MVERACSVCHEPIARGEGEPCLLCGGWFHFDFKRYPSAPACGVASDRVPGLVA
jgi:hypothetical protein